MPPRPARRPALHMSDGRRDNSSRSRQHPTAIWPRTPPGPTENGKPTRPERAGHPKPPPPAARYCSGQLAGTRPRLLGRPPRSGPLGENRAMATRMLHGRRTVDRDGAAEVAGLSLSSIDKFYAGRSRNGFPERIPGTTEWFEDDVRSWRAHHQQVKLATLTPVDRTGDPDELVGPAGVAKILGYRDPQNLRHSSVWPHLLAAVDRQEPLPSGRTRRRWRRSTVWRIADQRSGSGGGRPVGTPRAGHLDRTGDPDELLSAADAARVLGYNRAQALPAAILERADQVRTGPAGRTRRQWRRGTLWTLADTIRQPEPGA